METKSKKAIASAKNWLLGGRPLEYTPEQILERAEEYFAHLDNPDNYMDKGIGWKIPYPKTLSGLCLWLWVSKDYISEKAKDSRFAESIKRIRLEVEQNIEEGILMWAYNATAWIFNLKNNFGWVDKQEIDQKHSWSLEIIRPKIWE